MLEDAREVSDGLRREYLEITDLDLIASRVFDGEADGRNYEVSARACLTHSYMHACTDLPHLVLLQDLLLVSEVIGPAVTPKAAPKTKAGVPLTGPIEVTRRRVLKDGRVKLKMALLGVPVERCGACLAQFRRDERAALAPACKHS